MRRMLWVVATISGVVTLGGWAVSAWRRDPRIGSGFMNRVLNPRLMDHGLAGSGRSEIGMLEHIGRRSGTRRLTPVHPEPTPDGFRIVVPLGAQSEWARNVLASGHCRLQLHDVVYELDEPSLVPASQVASLPAVLRRVLGGLGFQYLLLRRFAAAPGTLGLASTGTTAPQVTAEDVTPTTRTSKELASSAT